MKFLLIFLVIIAILAVILLVFVLLHKARLKQMSPYVLKSVLTDEEYNLLVNIFDEAFSHWDIGSFKGGGVWKKEASPEQKMLLGSMKQGRLSWYELDLLMNYIEHMRLSAGEEADQVLGHLYNKLDQLKSSI